MTLAALTGALTISPNKGNTMQEILIYGLERGETRRYTEALLANFPKTDNAASNIEKVKAAASAEGYHSFRVATYNGEPPNFAAAIAL
jgi:hypothetical protein